MKKYIIVGGDGKEYGPVSVQEVNEWVSSGRANGETRIKEEGAEEWSRVGDLPEFNLSPEPRTPGQSSGTPTAQSSFNNQGFPPLPPDIETRNHDIWGAGCLTRGFEAYSANIGRASLMVLALLGIYVVAGIVMFFAFIPIFLGLVVLAAIPVIGPILVILAQTILPIILICLFMPLGLGPIYFFIKTARNQPGDVDDLFAGYKRNCMQCILTGFIQSIITHIVMIPGFVVFFLSGLLPFIKLIIEAAKAGPGAPPPSLPEWGAIAFAGMIVGLLLIIIPILYLGISWVYSMPLVVDRKMNFWAAMELSRKTVGKHWFKTFLYLIVVGMTANLGLILCGVGVFFTIPMAIAMLAASYVHIFDER